MHINENPYKINPQHKIDKYNHEKTINTTHIKTNIKTTKETKHKKRKYSAYKKSKYQ